MSTETKSTNELKVSSNPPLGGGGAGVIQNNLDYTLFSWSKQKGIAPIAVKHAEGVYMYDYDDKKIIECKYWPWRPAHYRSCC